MDAMSWIKIRTNLSTDPRVVNTSTKTGKHVCFVMGALQWLWALVDEHTEDGVLIGYTTAGIDRMVGIRGFCECLLSLKPTPWLIAHEDGRLEIANFDQHNGASAKKRVQTATRVAKFRNAPVTPPSVTGVTPALPKSVTSVTGALAREEKRREEKKKTEEGAAAKPAASPPVDPEPPWWSEQFCQRWAAKHGGTPYPFKGGRDGKALAGIRDILRGPEGQENRHLWGPIIDRYLADGRPYTVSKGHTLHYLAESIATYIAVPTGVFNGPAKQHGPEQRRTEKSSREYPDTARLPIAS